MLFGKKKRDKKEELKAESERIRAEKAAECGDLDAKTILESRF